MSTFSLLLAALLAISQYQPNVTPLDDFRQASPEEVVQVYHQTCKAILERPELKDLNPDLMIKLIRDIAEKSKPKAPEAPVETPEELAAETKEEASDAEVVETDPAEMPKIDSKKESMPEVEKPENAPGVQTDATTITQKDVEEAKKEFTKELNFEKLVAFYQEVCKSTPTAEAYEKFEMAKSVEVYETLKAQTPDHKSIVEKRIPQISEMLDRNGEALASIAKPKNLRSWVNYSEVPELLGKAFVAIEDKRFFQHKGIDENGLVRAFIKTFVGGGQIQGGSSITQQIIKNHLVGNQLKLERKIKELIIARRVESEMSKQDILEVYMNLIYLGRRSWGVKLAAQNYFGKSVKELTISEMAYIAGLARGPGLYAPGKNIKRGIERRNLVLKAMLKEKFITQEQYDEATKYELEFASLGVEINYAPYVAEHLKRAIKKVSKDFDLTNKHYKIQSTIVRPLQFSMERSLQKALVNYELRTRQARWSGPIVNIREELKAMRAKYKDSAYWVPLLENTRNKYADVYFNVAVITGINKKGAFVGIADGRAGRISSRSYRTWRRSLRYGDVVFVEQAAQGTWSLRHIPRVQGAAIAMDVHSGEVLALSGGFSYTSHPFNRATRSFRQPGSTIKPFLYLLGLQAGMGPNSGVRDVPVTFRRVRFENRTLCNRWSPRNYGGRASYRYRSVNHGLWFSKNLMAANLLTQLPYGGPYRNLQVFRNLTQEFGIYDNPSKCYPLVLGSGDTTLLRMAKAYAAIANGGTLIEPRFIQKIVADDGQPYVPATLNKRINSIHPNAFRTMRGILNGVVARGTAARAKSLAPYISGKTGTTNRNISAWFVGFSNDIVVAVYMGYDNATRRQKRSLGRGGTGGKLALPIAKEIFEASFRHYKKPAPLGRGQGIPVAALNESESAQPQPQSTPDALPVEENTEDSESAAGNGNPQYRPPAQPYNPPGAAPRLSPPKRFRGWSDDGQPIFD